MLKPRWIFKRVLLIVVFRKKRFCFKFLKIIPSVTSNKTKSYFFLIRKVFDCSSYTFFNEKKFTVSHVVWSQIFVWLFYGYYNQLHSIYRYYTGALFILSVSDCLYLSPIENNMLCVKSRPWTVGGDSIFERKESEKVIDWVFSPIWATVFSPISFWTIFKMPLMSVNGIPL